jgi:hypothetical protein
MIEQREKNGLDDSLEVNITPLGVVSFHRKGSFNFKPLISQDF